LLFDVLGDCLLDRHLKCSVASATTTPTPTLLTATTISVTTTGSLN